MLDVKNNLQSLFIHRVEAMGIAMLMVLLYHFKSTWFYPGFLGVDIFLFLSSYGLCRSYESNTISVFYKHRAIRIIPLYVLMGIGITFLGFHCYNSPFHWWDFICNITSLNYWGIGGTIAEWYLSFVIVLYILFPVLYFICNKVKQEDKSISSNHIYRRNNNWLGNAVSVVFFPLVMIVVLCALTVGFSWYYDTAIGRIPVFLMGILCYPFDDKAYIIVKRCIVIFALSLLLTVLLYMFGRVNTYVLLYMLSPLCLMLLGLFLRSNLCKGSIKSFLHIVGKYTLEIYVANVLVLFYRNSPNSIFNNCDWLSSALLYFLINIILAIALSLVNKGIKLLFVIIR